MITSRPSTSDYSKGVILLRVQRILPSVVINEKAITTDGHYGSDRQEDHLEDCELTIVGVMEDVIMGNPFKLG